ncbi:MAG: acyltransferase family protein [Thermoguttaceae bacterium]
MRVIAIVSILVCHLPEYLLGVPGVPSLWVVRPYAGVIGLGLFTFVSGYAIDVSQQRSNYRQPAWEFAKRRISRIFPLYIPAVLCFVVLFDFLGVWHHWTFAPLVPTIAIQLVGAQVLLSPRYQPMLTLWFVGAIIMYYGLYFALTRLTNRTIVFSAYGATIFVLGAVVRSVWDIIGIQFFLYWFPFLAGVVWHRLERQTQHRLNFAAAALAFVASVSAASVATVLRIPLFIEADNPARTVLGILPSFVSANVFMLSTTLVVLWLGRLSVTRISQSLSSRMSYLARLSYPVYLYHRPCLAILAVALLGLGVRQPVAQNLGVFFLAIPATVLFAICADAAEHRVTRLLSAKSAARLGNSDSLSRNQTSG